MDIKQWYLAEADISAWMLPTFAAFAAIMSAFAMYAGVLAGHGNNAGAMPFAVAGIAALSSRHRAWATPLTLVLWVLVYMCLVAHWMLSR